MGFRVVGIDTGKSKEDLVKSMGGEAFVDFKNGNVIEQVKKITNGGPHAAVIVAASAKPYEDALKMVRSKGTVVAVGLPSNTVIGADVFDTVVRSLTVKGSYVYVLNLNCLMIGEIVRILPRHSTFWSVARSRLSTRCVDCRSLQRFTRRWREGKFLDALSLILRSRIQGHDCHGTAIHS
jgi:NADPH:quinone reductase-like Zn-dependent oxidoreductase